MNLLDYCAVAVPMSLPRPVPFGITLTGPAFSDETLMGYATTFHTAAGIPMGKTSDFPETSVGQPAPPPERPVKLAVCGAHLKGLELHHQLVSADAVFVEKTTTAPCYAMFALEMSKPFKPGLLRDRVHGTRIEVEVYRLSHEAFGKFVAAIPHPLGIGKLELADGTWIPGFIAESVVRETGKDITEFGSWRNYLSSKS
jgi:allophanate hydrolase